MTFSHAVLSAGVGVTLATAGVGVGYRRVMDRPALWLVAWLVVDAIASVASTIGTIEFRNAQYSAQVWYPISSALALCLLASTLADAKARRAAFVAAAVVGLTITGLTIWYEKFGSFAKITGVLHGVTLLLVGSALVLQRARKARGDMFVDRTFLVGAAFVIMGAPSPFLAVAVRYFGPSKSELYSLVYTLKGLLAICSYVLMVVAIHLGAEQARLRLTRAAA
ncbi:MAG: hypothetical protein IPP98_10950 [Gemmatimonadetes bacterium]|nr:hypothetical protein [Gemmatimonadota bacterium]